jgi:hypothetical protein
MDEQCFRGFEETQTSDCFFYRECLNEIWERKLTERR